MAVEAGGDDMSDGTLDLKVSAPWRRHVALPGGLDLDLRPVTSDDIDALVELYDGLDAASRYRRFFSVFRPDRRFFERLAAVTERGGAGLVAIVSGTSLGQQLVGEATYELLPNGNGELAIVVDAHWRGWLGPMLLDALFATAAARCVPNLEAEVLLTNGPMLALLRSRGYALVPNGDWTAVRAVLGTTGPVPTWPVLHDHPRLLVEAPGGRWSGAAAAQSKGIDVLVCPGPTGRHRRCPLLSGEPCPLAVGADAIVVCNPPESEEWNVVRAGHGQLHRGVPVGVDLPVNRSHGGTTEHARLLSDDPASLVEKLAGGDPTGDR